MLLDFSFMCAKDSSSTRTNQVMSLSMQFVMISLMNLSFPIKLYHSNYFLWKEQLLSVIFAYGVKDFINDSHVAPTMHI